MTDSVFPLFITTKAQELLTSCYGWSTFQRFIANKHLNCKLAVKQSQPANATHSELELCLEAMLSHKEELIRSWNQSIPGYSNDNAMAVLVELTSGNLELDPPLSPRFPENFNYKRIWKDYYLSQPQL